MLYNGYQAAKEEPRLLGTVENELGIREFLESQGHTYVVTSDKEGPDSVFQKEIVDVRISFSPAIVYRAYLHATQAEVLITTPFHPGYLTADIIKKAKNLKMCITAGVGSDHIDLNAAVEHGIEGHYHSNASSILPD